MLHAISGTEASDRKADVVFVHGLGGDAFGTWQFDKDTANLWPYWMGKAFPHVGVWSLGYPASPSKLFQPLGWFLKRYRDAGQGMALPDRALQALNLMTQRGIGQRSLLFIGHSLGGLVIKQILRKSSDAPEPRKKKIFTSTRAVLFLATPHQGASLASWIDVFRDLFQATVTIEDLRAHSPGLRDLFDWYRNHSAAAGIQTASYYEQRPYKGLTLVVDPTSAHPGVGEDPVASDEDHISIAKPARRDAEVCEPAAELLRYCLSRSAPPSTPAAIIAPPSVTVHIDAATLTQQSPVRVPHELPPPAEEFFGRLVELERLRVRLRERKNTAVVGAAGLGKTALAAKALREVVGETPGGSPERLFPDGIVFLDLYALHGAAEAAWDTLANRLGGGPGFLERSPARDRAIAACQGRQILFVIEGGEEADGREGRSSIGELFSVLSPENRWLLLTRLSNQVEAAKCVALKEALHPDDAGRLFDSLTKGCVTGEARARVLGLLDGHPLALTWAGNLLARGDESPERMVQDWAAEQLPGLSDPEKAPHTLGWLYRRSVRGLDRTAQKALEAAALLARAPFPLAAIEAALDDGEDGGADGRAALKPLVQCGLLRWSDRETDFWEFTHVLGYRFARKETGSDPEMRERLGRWLHGHLTRALVSDAGGRGPSLTGRDLKHLGALLSTDEDQLLWQLLAVDALYDFVDRVTDLGRLGQVRQVLGAVAGWFDRFPPGGVDAPYWARERSSLLDRQGNVLRDCGDLVGAEGVFRESLEVRQRLAGADPSNAVWQRDVSVSLNNVGNVLRDQGDLAGALAAFRESLEVRRRLAGDDPSNAGWQRDVSVSLNKVGNVLRDQGDLGGAEAALRESLEVRQRLAGADPSNAGWQRDVSVSLDKMGDVLRDSGDLAGAEAAYRESLEVSRRLAGADPSNAGWRRDVSVSLNNVGNLLRDQGIWVERSRRFGSRWR